MPILVSSLFANERNWKEWFNVCQVLRAHHNMMGKKQEQDIRRLVTCMSSIEEEGGHLMGLGCQASKSACTDLIFPNKVPLPKCSTSLKRAPQSGEQIFKHNSLWRLFHINATIMSSLVKFKAACLQENWKFENVCLWLCQLPGTGIVERCEMFHMRGIEPQSSRTASALSHWAISPAT